MQGLKWGRVARVGDSAPFDLPDLYRVSCLLSCSSKSHKIPPAECTKTHHLQIKNLKKFWEGGTRPRIAGETRLLSWTMHFKHCIYGKRIAYFHSYRTPLSFLLAGHGPLGKPSQRGIPTKWRHGHGSGAGISATIFSIGHMVHTFPRAQTPAAERHSTRRKGRMQAELLRPWQIMRGQSD